MTDLFEKAKSFFFINRCASCGELLKYDSDEVLCPECKAKWEDEKNEKCEDCKQIQTRCRCGFEGCSADTVGHLASYSHKEESVGKKLVFALKNSHDSHIVGFLARETAENIRTYLFTENAVAVNVPRNPRRVSETGYDQAKMLAKAVAKELGIPFVSVLRQNKDKVSQKTLDREKREEHARRNVVFAEGSSGLIKDKTVLLVDDIGTTGSTVSVCSSILKENGARAVHCVLVAKTKLETPDKNKKTLDKSAK